MPGSDANRGSNRVLERDGVLRPGTDQIHGSEVETVKKRSTRNGLDVAEDHGQLRSVCVPAGLAA